MKLLEKIGITAPAPAADAPQTKARVAADELDTFVDEGRTYLERRAELESRLAARVGGSFTLEETDVADFARVRAGVDLAAALEPALRQAIEKHRSRALTRNGSVHGIVQDRQAALERTIATAVRAALPPEMFDAAAVDVTNARPLTVERAARLNIDGRPGWWPLPHDAPIEERLDQLAKIAGWLRVMANELDRLDALDQQYSERKAA